MFYYICSRTDKNALRAANWRNLLVENNNNCVLEALAHRGHWRHSQRLRIFQNDRKSLEIKKNETEDLKSLYNLKIKRKFEKSRKILHPKNIKINLQKFSLFSLFCEKLRCEANSLFFAEKNLVFASLSLRIFFQKKFRFRN